MQWNTEIEDALRADPSDEALWSVLEDWTLAQGDERAHVIELEKARDPRAKNTMQRQVAPLLIGSGYRALRDAMSARWRAGYLVGAAFDARGAPRHALLAQLLAKRCARLLGSLAVTIDEPSELATIPPLLAGTVVRELTISAYWTPPRSPATFEPAWLAPLAIEVLALRSRPIALPYGEPLARLRALTLTPGIPDDLRAPFRGPLPRLEELVVLAGPLSYDHDARTLPFDEVLAGDAAPELRRLRVCDSSPELRRVLIERLVGSALLPRLEQFSFGYDRLDLTLVPAEHRAMFERFG